MRTPRWPNSRSPGTPRGRPDPQNRAHSGAFGCEPFTIHHVSDSAQARSVGPPPPSSDLPPRVDVVPNDNPPIGTVGPNVPQGVGDQHVIYPAAFPPPQAVAWQGWPSEWAVPWGNGVQIAGLLDVVFAAVDRNASAFASMPPSSIKGGRRLAEQPTWSRNPQPEVYASWHEFAQQVWWAFQLAGEALVVATSRFADSGYPRTFFVAPPWLLQVEILDGQRSYFLGGEDITTDVCAIRYVSTVDDAHGHSPMETATNRLRTIAALQRYGTDLASQGGVPWGVLKAKNRMTADQALDLRMQWVTAARDRLGAPAVLDNDTDLMVTQMQPKDMQLVELQQAAEARLAVLLGVPPYMLALPTNAGSLTYNTATLIYAEHYGWLRTKISQIAGALSGWAVPWGTDIEFDAERYIQAPAKERADYYSSMFAIVDPVTGQRAMTIDEIRRAERVDLLEAPS